MQNTGLANSFSLTWSAHSLPICLSALVDYRDIIKTVTLELVAKIERTISRNYRVVLVLFLLDLIVYSLLSGYDKDKILCLIDREISVIDTLSCFMDFILDLSQGPWSWRSQNSRIKERPPRAPDPVGKGAGKMPVQHMELANGLCDCLARSAAVTESRDF